MMAGNEISGVTERSGLPQTLIDSVADAGRRHGAHKIVLFGSRARGDFRERSDIDIAVYGMKQQEQTKFASDIDDCPTLVTFDVVHVSPNLDARFLSSIERDGVTIMEEGSSKLDHFIRAIDRTKEGVAEYKAAPTHLNRDGVIQRFEFTAELAWKSCRAYLIEQAYVGVDSPMSVMKTAYAAGLVSDEQGWIDLLRARNVTSHMYSDSQADAVFQDIDKRFLPLLESARDKLLGERQ